jgi:hypothetical protein
MINRSLIRRLQKLQEACVTKEPLSFVIHFVDPGGEITSTLTTEDGVETWWHAPGHASPEKNRPMSANVPK